MAALDVTILLAYFCLVTAIGFVTGRATKTTREYFFAGQRYGWFLIAMSCVATTVGSYSFVKYSGAAFAHGFAATQNYLNDWMWVALFVGGWLPILWRSGVSSVPEYFHRRFGKGARDAVTTLLLVYMVGYIGINFLTLGKVLHLLQPLSAEAWWSELGWAALVAVLCAIYVTAGGQVSVIVTDLFQGALLLVAGLSLVWLGADALASHGGFWAHFPSSQRAAFTPLTEPPDLAAVNLFWQDGFANSAAFYFINQGLVMRFLSARSEAEGRKALVFVVIVLMPLAAVAVCGGGWVASALADAGLMTAPADGDQVFVTVTRLLTHPGVFGLVVAALTAALMSTADTLINACAAIVVNDIWRPYVRPAAPDAHYLSVARWASIGTALVAIVLVPVFMQFKTIFDAHGMFTAAVTPPLVIALMLGMLWKRATSAGAMATLLGGGLLIALSMRYPSLIAPFSHGVAPGGEGAGAWKYLRALFGVVACGALGVVTSLLTRPSGGEHQRNLVVGQLDRTEAPAGEAEAASDRVAAQ